MSEVEAAPDVPITGADVPAVEPANDNDVPDSGNENAVVSTEQAQTAADALDAAVEVAPDAEGNRVFKVEINGQEVEVTEDEMRRGYQRAAAAGARFREAKALKDSVEADRAKIAQWAKQMQADPLRTLERELGPEALQAAAEDYFAEKLKREQMSPAELKALEMEQELKSIKAKEAQRQKAIEAQTYERKVVEYREKFEGDLFSALDEAGISKEDRAAYLPQAAAMMQASLDDKGNPGLTIADIAGHLLEEERSRTERILGGKWSELSSLEGDALLEAIPESVQKQIQKAMLAKVKNPSELGVRVTGKPRSKAKEDQPKVVRSFDEWQEHFRAKRGA